MKDYYQRLGVSPDASRDDIKGAYRQLARRYHPDAAPAHEDTAEIFKNISEAYQTLINTEKRAAYDRQRGAGGETPSKPAATTSAYPPRPVYQPLSSQSAHTNAFIRTVFIVVLITLIILIAQVLLFMQSPTPNRVSVSAANSQFSADTSGNGVGTLARRPVNMMTDTRLDAEATYACSIDVLTAATDCERDSGVAFVQPLADNRAVVQVELLPPLANRMAIRVDFEGVPVDWTLNIGDTIANNGTLGDGTPDRYDAQVSVYGHDLLVYGNEANANNQIDRIEDVVPDSGGALYLVVGNASLTWFANGGGEAIVSQYLFNVPSESAAIADTDRRLFIGVNQTVAGRSNRFGEGVVRVQFWLLP